MAYVHFLEVARPFGMKRHVAVEFFFFRIIWRSLQILLRFCVCSPHWFVLVLSHTSIPLTASRTQLPRPLVIGPGIRLMILSLSPPDLTN